MISGTGQNLRHTIDAAAPLTALIDGTFTNPTTPWSTVLGVTSAAHTNNDLNTSTARTPFDLDSMADRISPQSPAAPRAADHRRLGQRCERRGSCGRSRRGRRRGIDSFAGVAQVLGGDERGVMAVAVRDGLKADDGVCIRAAARQAGG